jgi:hypothetical protein
LVEFSVVQYVGGRGEQSANEQRRMSRAGDLRRQSNSELREVRAREQEGERDSSHSTLFVIMKGAGAGALEKGSEARTRTLCSVGYRPVTYSLRSKLLVNTICLKLSEKSYNK